MLVGTRDQLQPKVQLVRDDLVQSISNPQNVGIVSRLSSDSISNSNLEMTNEDNDSEGICTGFARVLWLKSQELDEDITNLRVIDRSFTLGDIVAPLENPISQTGIVKDVCTYVDLELANGKIVEGIDSCKLRHVRSYMPGDYVIHNNWLGCIEEVMDNVTIIFDGGAKCKIFRADIEHLIPVESIFTDEKNSPYYPGQKVRGATPGVFKLAKWLKGSWKETLMEGIISGVEVGSILVSWITSSLTSSGLQPSTMPAMLQKPSTLHPLMYIPHINCQLGDRLLLPLGFDVEEYSLITRNETNILNQKLLHTIPSCHRSPVDFNNKKLESSSSSILDTNIIVRTLDVHKQKLNRQQKRARRRECKTTMKNARGIEHAALVVKTKTKVDVMWQDGTRSSGIEASSLIPIEYLSDHEFWPEQFVMERGLDGEDIDHSEHQIGVIKSVNATQRTAIVRWLEQAEKFKSSHKSSIEENVSVYEIVEHPHFNYRLGDVVVRLTMGQSMMKLNECQKELISQGLTSCMENEFEVSKDVNIDDRKIVGDEKLQISRNKDIEVPQKEGRLLRRRGHERKSRCSSYPIIDLSWVGNVIDLKDGEISVVWADGNISKVGPTDIFVVNNEEEIQIEENEYQIIFDSNNLTWSSMEYNEDVRKESSQISLKSILDQSSLITQASAIEIDKTNVQEKCTKKLIHKSLVQKMKEVQDANLAICSPHQYRGQIEIVCKKFVSQLTNILRNLKSQSSNLICTKGTLLCSNIDDIIDTYHNLGRSNHSSMINASIDQNSKTTISNSSVDNNKYMCSNCSSQSEHPKKDVGHNTSYVSKMPPKELSNVAKVTGLHSLLHSNSEQDDICNSEPSKNQNQIVEGIQENSKWLRQFDFVHGVADHHFVGLEYQNPQRKWIKKVQDEWRILEKNLPNSIYVRIYEDRMDLLRVAIVGAQGTPYHDGLFIFDFHLPQEFPLVPPVAFYHSRGLQLNPNLYENGNVCLSLLNTWIGKESEVWNATNSSILQLLISIQGLVLNATPYFNEDGYGKQMGLPEGEKNSFLYNESAFLLSCKSTLHLLHQPLQHFEEITWYHFKERGPMLLKTCKAYLQGAVVGSIGENLQSNDYISGFSQSSTMGFRIMLDKLLAKLTIAFAKLENQSNYQLLECHSSLESASM